MKLPLNLCSHPSNRTASSSIPSSVYLQQPLIRLLTATLNSSIYNNPKSVPSSRRTTFFLGGFVFVATTVVAQTQHKDRDFLSGFVFVAAATVAQTQHTEQPLIHPIIRPDCFFWVGLFLWHLANQV